MKSIGRLLLRLSVGGFFVGHGSHKLGFFGGRGIDATAGMFEQLGLRPGKRNAIAAGLAEAGGGAGIVLGAATPLSAAVLISTMLTAIKRVHLSKGPWITEGGYEYNVVLIAALVTLVETGPGKPSVDAARGKEMNGAGWGLAALALGAAGAAGAHLAAEAAQAPPQEPEPAASDTATENEAAVA